MISDVRERSNTISVNCSREEFIKESFFLFFCLKDPCLNFEVRKNLDCSFKEVRIWEEGDEERQLVVGWIELIISHI